MAFMFMFATVLSIFMGLSSPTFFAFWVSLELNTLVFISLLAVMARHSPSQPLLYFVPQAIASSGFMSLSILKMAHFSQISSFLILITLLIKAGASPFHFWFIKLAKSMSKELFWALSSIQKILPLYFISVCFWTATKEFVVFSAITSVLSALSSIVIMEILAFSSLFTLSWLLTSSFFPLMMAYLAVYSLSLWIVLSTIDSTKNYGARFILFNSWLQKVNFFAAVLMMAGMPPFISFIPKVLIVSEMVSAQQAFLAGFLVLTSAFFFFIYINLIIVSITSKSISLSISPTQKMSTSAIMLLALTPLVMWTLKKSVAAQKILIFQVN